MGQIYRSKKQKQNTPTTDRTKRHRMLHWQMVALFLAIYDLAAVFIAHFGALLMRFDGHFSEIPKKYLTVFKQSILIYGLICVVVFMVLKLYHSIWRFAGYTELLHMFVATAITGVINVVLVNTAYEHMPVSYHFFGLLGQFVLTVGVRFSYRFVLLIRGRRNIETEELVYKRVMLIGAGQAGQMILRDIKISKETSERVVCFIDDEPNKQGRIIDGVPIVGNREDILTAVQKYQVDKIYVAIPSASLDDKREILNICKETGCELLNLPGMYQLYSGEVKVSQMKEVAIEDLLGRDPIRVEMDEIYAYIEGKVIMVTGGGGSIGSELCRQIASHNPKQLIILDIYENNAYEIQQELKKNYPDLKLEVLIASVRDSRRMFDVFRTYKPQIVYHAAAHKHVPLMEDSPCEAIKNNAIGTYKTAYAAMVFGTERFVLISTDKAVNPTNIMGASKRLCEMIIQAFDQKIKEGKGEQIPQLFTHWSEEVELKEEYLEQVRNAKTEFVAVRFGNVLGSNGSVIPLFKKQIVAGGPVTVTHPDIIRYFMTIPEAVSLVMQAGTYAHGGEIFVLDMGCPVKIDTLARNLIKLSGYKPDIDIKVEYTGLRPGEKLYEEKLMAEEGLKTTKNKLIHIGCPIPFDTEVFLSQLEQLMNMAYRNKPEIVSYVEQVVSTFHPAGKKGSEEKTKAYEEQKMQMAQQE